MEVTEEYAVNALYAGPQSERELLEAARRGDDAAIGVGQPVFTNLKKSSGLTLMDSKPYDSGRILLRYRPA